jgi:CRISPR/Cas system-associated protein Cas7 (RAMP superfamily)
MITAYGRNRCRQRRALSSLRAIERMIRSSPSSTRTTFFPIVQVPVGLKRVGREMRMVENADDQTPAACPLMAHWRH